MRLFAGIALDDATRAACGKAVEELRRTGFSAKFEQVDKLHVTLAFLGNVDPSQSTGVVDALESTAAGTAPFEFLLDKVGAFPNERKPRIVYVGAREQGRAFRVLSARLRAAYRDLGFTFKDDAVAHVTIARVKDPRRPLPLIDAGPAVLPVTTLTLFESIHDKTKNTSRYVISATSELRGA